MERVNAKKVACGQWSLDVDRELLHVDGKVVRIQRGVLKLLLFLVDREGQVISKADLIDAVWDGRAVSDAAIYNRVNALRSAIADENGPEQCIKWEYGRGLRFARPNSGVIDGLRSTKTADDPLEVLQNLPVPQNPVQFAGTASLEDWKHLLGTYHLFYRTPSWPNAIKIGVSVLAENDGRISVHTIEQGQDPGLGIRQDARYLGHAELIDGRIYVFEQNQQPPRAVCLTVLDTPHAYSPDMMTGMMMGSSWRLRGAPYATRVIWRRLPPDLTLRDAIQESGPRAVGTNVDQTTEEVIGPHCLTIQASQNSLPSSVMAPPTDPDRSAADQGDPMSGPATIAILTGHVVTEDAAVALSAQGLISEVSAQLSRFRRVRVSVLSAATSESENARSERSDRGVRYELASSFTKLAKGIRVTCHLVDTSMQTQIWANSWELQGQDDTKSQDETILAIVTSVVTVVKDHQLVSANLKDIDELSPWECYLRGSALVHTFDPQAQGEAIAILRRGIDLDPGLADLHAALSYAMNTQYKLPIHIEHASSNGNRRTPVRIRAHDCARKALEIDSRVPFAWTALGRSHLGLGEFDEAISACKRALELNPNLGWAYFVLGYCYWPLSRGADAIRAFEAAFETLREESARWAVVEGKACALMVAGQYEEAIEMAHRAQIDPRAGHFSACAEICSLSQLGDHKRARHAFRKAVEIDPHFSLALIEHDQPLPEPAVRNLIADGFSIAGCGDV